MVPRRKYLIIFIVCVGFGAFYSLNLITTRDILKPDLIFKKNPLNIFEHDVGEIVPAAPVVPASVVRINSKNIHETKKLPVVETLFRGDIPLKPILQSNGFPPENKLQIPTNGHQNGDALNFADGNEYGVEKLTPVKIAYKLVHIDLKGAPPKLPYLKSLFKIISSTGGNGILLEYEDMFPFKDSLKPLSHKYHFSKEEIQDLISTATQYNLEVIPLIQTFGHLELALKLSEFRPLREIDAYPQEICPSNEEAWKLVTNIIDQVLALNYNNNSKNNLPNYIHIGCDEVYHIGECYRCKEKQPKDLFLNHVGRIGKYIKEKYGIIPIIWDDMLRKFYIDELIKSEIGSHVELMMWDYTEDVDRLLSPYLWPMYTQVFPNIWVASAYKGAFGETLHKVDVHRHALNQISWLRVLARESSKVRNLRGVALTGWSRYDHFSVLCELLPVAIPSIILALQIWTIQDYSEATTNLFKFLKCDENKLDRLDQCSWEGVDLSNALNTLEFYQTQTNNLVQAQRTEKGWLTDYNIRYNYSSPWRLSEAIQQSSQYLNSIEGFETTIRSILRKYFHEYVVTEWIEQKIYPVVTKLKSLLNDAQGVGARRVWERRPVKHYSH